MYSNRKYTNRTRKIELLSMIMKRSKIRVVKSRMQHGRGSRREVVR
jgi:hypothetical protein